MGVQDARAAVIHGEYPATCRQQRAVRISDSISERWRLDVEGTKDACECEPPQAYDDTRPYDVDLCAQKAPAVCEPLSLNLALEPIALQAKNGVREESHIRSVPATRWADRYTNRVEQLDQGPIRRVTWVFATFLA
jgi:hypothetical protein